MTNLFLGVLATGLWSVAYVWYFRHDLARLWHRLRRGGRAPVRHFPPFEAQNRPWDRRPTARPRPAPSIPRPPLRVAGAESPPPPNNVIPFPRRPGPPER